MNYVLLTRIVSVFSLFAVMSFHFVIYQLTSYLYIALTYAFVGAFIYLFVQLFIDDAISLILFAGVNNLRAWSLTEKISINNFAM